MSEKQPSRVTLKKEDLEKLSREDLVKKWQLQDGYLDCLESTEQKLQEKLQKQKAETTRRENILVQRLSTKVQEKDACFAQLQYLKQSLSPSSSHLKTMLVDPAVKLLFDKMQSELDEKKVQLAEMQNDMNAWKFTPDSNTGKRLMMKCRKLHQENEELGKLIASGRVAKLESELALQKSLSQEIKQSQNELDDLMMEMEENAQLMQSSIFSIQEQLREANSKIEELKAENRSLKEQVVALQDKLTSNHHSNSEEISKNGGVVENHRTHPPEPQKDEEANDELKLPSKSRTKHRTPPVCTSVEGNGETPPSNNCLKWGNITPAKSSPKIKRTSCRTTTTTTTTKKSNCDAGRTSDGLTSASPKRFKSSEENTEDEVSSTEVQVAKTLANWANGEVEH